MSDKERDTYRTMLDESTVIFEHAATAISAEVSARRRKIPLAMFENILAPIVRAWVCNVPGVEPGPWMNIADGMHNEIDVVDADGTIVFILPPPYIDTELPSEPPVGRIVTTHTLVQQQHEMINNGDQRGAMAIENGILSAFLPANSIPAKAKYLRMYIDIWKRYEWPMEEILGPDASIIMSELTTRTTHPDTSGAHDDDESPTLIY